jgi:GDPmannose 4,6-dehydratase
LDRSTALITGISGQDGSYLAEILVENGYRVVGIVRGPKSAPYPRIEHLRDAIELDACDLLDQNAIEGLLRHYRPTEVYNLCARANSAQSFSEQVRAGQFDGLAVLRMLEAIRFVDPTIRFCQASTSEMFGKAHESPQKETTIFYPRNPYGVAKLYGHWITVNYRETQRMFACCSILFNHESPRRGELFVTRKVSRAAARIKAGLQDEVRLGDLDARRDWGYALDYVRGMWLMLQAPTADDYVLATGETHSVRELCSIAFGHVGLYYENHVVQEMQEQRPPDTVQLVGDSEKARRVLKWRPTLTFEELVRTMVDSDLGRLAREGYRR